MKVNTLAQNYAQLNSAWHLKDWLLVFWKKKSNVLT